MNSKSVLIEEKPFSGQDLVRANKLVEEIRKAKKDPEFFEAAKEFYKHHTGKELKI